MITDLQLVIIDWQQPTEGLKKRSEVDRDHRPLCSILECGYSVATFGNIFHWEVGTYYKKKKTGGHILYNIWCQSQRKLDTSCLSAERARGTKSFPRAEERKARREAKFLRPCVPFTSQPGCRSIHVRSAYMYMWGCIGCGDVLVQLCISH